MELPKLSAQELKRWMDELGIDEDQVAKLAFSSRHTVKSWLRVPTSKAHRSMQPVTARLLTLEFERMKAESKLK